MSQNVLGYHQLMNTLVWTFFHATKRQKLTSQQTYPVHGDQVMLFPHEFIMRPKKAAIDFVSRVLNEIEWKKTVECTEYADRDFVASLNAIAFFQSASCRVLPCNHNTMCASHQQSLVLWPLFPIECPHCLEFMIIPWTHSVCPGRIQDRLIHTYPSLSSLSLAVGLGAPWLIYINRARL
jgi:hypothetical protein